MFPDIRTFLEKIICRKTLLLLVLLCITTGVYWQVNHHEFINYDDPEYVINNPKVYSGVNIENIFWAFTSLHASNWHPLTWMSHMLDVQLFGLNAGWHHLMNVFIHLANTILLFLFLNRATGAYWQSLFVAALFALHPLHVESVAWVAERKDVLSTLFWMLALIFYSGFVERPSRSRYLLVLCVFAFGLMSKPMLVTLPFALLLLDYWPLERMTPWRSNLRRLLWEKIPFIFLSVASGIVTILAQQKGGTVAHLKGVPVVFRGSNAMLAYVAYMGKMIWPNNLVVIYPLPHTITMLQVSGAGLILVCITVICFRFANRHPYLIVGWFWYLLTLVPVIGLVQVGKQFIADRYTYIPLIGLFTMFAWGTPVIFAGKRYGRMALSFIAGSILLIFMVLTWKQVGYWKNTITLFTHATNVSADNYVAHGILGDTLVVKGRIDDAMRHYSKALQVRPDDKNALIGMGIALVKQGKIEESLAYFNEELRIDPASADGYFYKGSSLMEQGNIDEAIQNFFKALRIEPGRADVQINLGTALISQGNKKEGFHYYSAALENDPSNAEIHVTVGLALAMDGSLDEGITHFRDAIRIKPTFVDAHYNLGAALARQGKLDEAIVHFTEALRLDPGLSVAQSSLAAAIQRKEKPANH